MKINHKIPKELAVRLRSSSFIAIVLVYVTFSVNIVGAISKQQIDAFDSGIYYFNYDDDCQTTNTTPSGQFTATSGSAASIPPGSPNPYLTVEWPSALNNFPDEAISGAINKFIIDKYSSSPFKSLGGNFLLGASTHQINPFLAVAMARQESQLATIDAVRNKGTFNAFGRRASSSQPNIDGWYKWESWADSLSGEYPGQNKQSWFLYMRNFVNQGVYPGDSVYNMLTKYAPSSDGNDPNSYHQSVIRTINELAALAGDPNVASYATPATGGGTGAGCTCTVLSGSSSGTLDDSFIQKLDPSKMFPAYPNERVEPITPTGVVLHWTAMDPNITPENMVRSMHNTGVSVQLYIDGGGNVYQLYPDLATKARHAANSNSKTIGIEIGGRGESDLENNSIQKQAVIKTVAYIVSKYNMPTDPVATVDERKGILSHHLVYEFDSDPPNRNLLVKYDVGEKYHKEIVEAVRSILLGEGCSSSEGNGVVAGSIVQTALNLAWHDKGHGPNESDATPAYQAAKKQYNPGPPWSDCGGFVSTVMRASRVDPEFPSVGAGAILKYLNDNSGPGGKYISLGQPANTDTLKPGDILVHSDHVMLYVGTQPGGFNAASASLGERVPQASNFYNDSFYAFRVR